MVVGGGRASPEGGKGLPRGSEESLQQEGLKLAAEKTSTAVMLADLLDRRKLVTLSLI